MIAFWNSDEPGLTDYLPRASRNESKRIPLYHARVTPRAVPAQGERFLNTSCKTEIVPPLSRWDEEAMGMPRPWR